MAERVQAAKVRNISVEDIQPNPHNPRRLFDEEPMRVLRESVQKLGILVPVTLYESDQRPGIKSPPYVLLDGERRWRCAMELKLPKVPAIVVERPTDARNILTMFHIHNVRAGWQLMPTALKLQTLMQELDETNERNLAELTKLSISQIRRCKILLSYQKRFQDMMLAPPSRRMKADFFIELDRIRRPALQDDFEPWIRTGDAKVITLLLAKYEAGIIKAVTDFRHLAEIYRASTTAKQRKRLISEFSRFLEHSDVGIDDIHVAGASFAKEAKEIQRSARRLLTQIADMDPSAIASNEQTVKTLKKLVSTLHDKLNQGLLLGVRDGASDED